MYKLGQKIRVDAGNPAAVAHTTLYLTESEYDLLRALPGKTVVKTRTLLPWGELMVAVDVFSGH